MGATAGKKYLFVADAANQWHFSGKVIDAFIRKAFKTDSTLFLLTDNSQEANNFHNYTSRKIFWGGVRIALLNTDEVNLFSILPQVDFAIFPPENEIAPIGFVEMHGRKFVQRFANTLDELFSDLPVPAEVENTKKNWAAQLDRDFFAKIPPNEFEYIVFYEGLGESTAFFFWMKKYREHSKKKICCICDNHLRAELFSACPYVDLVVSVDSETFNFISIYYAEKYDVKKIFVLKSALKNWTESRKHHAKKEPYGIIENIGNCLGIRYDVPFEKYPFALPAPRAEKAKKVFDDMNLTKGKTVFVVTEGFWYRGLGAHHKDFWLKLRDKLNSVGYEIVTNGPSIPDCRHVFLSLFETSAFAGLCGHIVSVPTGLVESICAVNMVDKITLQTLHPSDTDNTSAPEHWKRPNVSIAEIMKGYAHMVNQYISSNIDCTYRQFGNNPEEDDALVEKIVEKILR